MKARMSTERRFLDASDREAKETGYTDSPIPLRTYSISQEHYSEEARNEQAYRAYKQDLGDLCEPDHDLEKDFFGQRELTIGDFDGTNTIVTPSASPARKFKNSAKNHALALTVTNHPCDQYVDNSTQPNDPRQSQNERKTYTSQKTHITSSYSDGDRQSVLGGPDASRFSYTYSIAEKAQQSLQLSNCRSSPTGTEIELPPQDKASAFTTTYSAQGVHSNEDIRSCMQCVGYMDTIDALLQAGCDISYDTGAKFNVVGHHIHLENSINEKARVASETAEICDGPIPELDQDDDADSVASSQVMELGYDASPGTLHFFSQAGVYVTTRNLQDDFVSAQATNLAGGYLDIDQTAEDEKAQVNIDFFQRQPLLNASPDFPAVLLPSDHHNSQYISPYGRNGYVTPGSQDLIPAIVDDLADPDYYLGPSAPALDDTIFDKIYQNRYAIQQDDAREQADPSLSNRRADRSSNVMNQSLPIFLPFAFSGQESNYANNSLIDVASSPPRMPSPRISKIPNYGESFLVKKRPARESFDLIALCDENAQREFASKKPRLASHLSDTSVQIPPTPTSAVSSVFAYSPMATALSGYAGQFEIHLPESLSNVKASAEQHVFGSHLHANGEVINTRFVADTSGARQDLSDSPNLRPTIEHGYLHHCFAEEMPRTFEEEQLRKEAHRECSAARLEGVPVGYYRYYAGHMTVEEYVDARLCVCWDRCFCNKLCTRFGDLACPCAEHLIVGDD